MAQAWRQGVEAVTGIACSPVAVAWEFKLLESMVTTHGGGCDGNDAIVWLTTTATAYVKAQRAAKYDGGKAKGYHPSGALGWLNGGGAVAPKPAPVAAPAPPMPPPMTPEQDAACEPHRVEFQRIIDTSPLWQGRMAKMSTPDELAQRRAVLKAQLLVANLDSAVGQA